MADPIPLSSSSHISVSHAYARIVDFGEPVEIDSLKIASGDLLYGDRHGVINIPLPIVARVPLETSELQAEEQELNSAGLRASRLGGCRSGFKHESQLRFILAGR
jgi:regulator of RNase E activity RraA